MIQRSSKANFAAAKLYQHTLELAQMPMPIKAQNTCYLAGRFACCFFLFKQNCIKQCRQLRCCVFFVYWWWRTVVQISQTCNYCLHVWPGVGRPLTHDLARDA